ncbi:hypothetical protein V6N13_004535 [Hibiscus sabdariffa]
MRLMPRQSYLIAMLNKGVLAFPLPAWVPGARPTVRFGHHGTQHCLMLTKTLEWTLNWCKLQTMLDRWCNDGALPQSYICPPETRPGKLTIPRDDNIPVISLGEASTDRNNTIINVLKASQEFGLFQVVNHGVSEKLLNDTMNIVAEFFEMPMEDKASLYSEDPNKACRLYTSNTYYGTGKYHFWRDVLKHPCHQLEACIKLWPQKPTRYRHMSNEIVDLALQIVSNNKLKSAEHRVVTNSKAARTTVGLFISSCDDNIIEPASAAEPPLYRPFRYREFLSHYYSTMGDTELALQPFKVSI